MDGTLFNHTDSYMPDDVDFGATWHAASGGGFDFSVSGQGWDSAGDIPVKNLNSSVLITRCPGQSVSYAFSQLNKGKNSLSGVKVGIVMSPNTIISTNDHRVQTWTTSLPRGGWRTDSGSFVVPNLAPGDYTLGAVADPENVLSETDGLNNAVTLSRVIRIPSSGC